MTSVIRDARFGLPAWLGACVLAGLLCLTAVAVQAQDVPASPPAAVAEPAAVDAVPAPVPVPAPAPASLPAAGNAADAAASTGGGLLDTPGLPTFLELYNYSPIINGIILGLSVVAVLLFLFLLITVNGRAMVPPDLVEELTKLVMRGKYEAVADLCRAHRRVFIASIVQRCAENAGKPHAVLMEIVDSEGRRRAEIIWNRLSYLADISNITPMLGLLGTVIGMIKAFFMLDTVAGGAASRHLASGIGEAMSTTMFGLAVAISTLVLYSIIKSRATQSLALAEQAVHSIADHMKRAAPSISPSEAAAAGGTFSNPSLRMRPRPGAVAGDE